MAEAQTWKLESALDVAWVEKVRQYEHLYEGMVAQAIEEGQSEEMIRQAYRRLTTCHQVVAYLGLYRPDVLEEAAAAIGRALGIEPEVTEVD
jgi:hypothetical protein